MTGSRRAPGVTCAPSDAPWANLPLGRWRVWGIFRWLLRWRRELRNLLGNFGHAFLDIPQFRRFNERLAHQGGKVAGGLGQFFFRLLRRVRSFGHVANFAAGRSAG